MSKRKPLRQKMWGVVAWRGRKIEVAYPTFAEAYKRFGAFNVIVPVLVTELPKRTQKRKP